MAGPDEKYVKPELICQEPRPVKTTIMDLARRG